MNMLPSIGRPRVVMGLVLSEVFTRHDEAIFDKDMGELQNINLSGISFVIGSTPRELSPLHNPKRQLGTLQYVHQDAERQ